MGAYRQTCLHEAGEMETYAFANQKGGVGKTTVTLGLAAALARAGASVLLVDLDPQGSATRVLGVDVDEHPTVADVVLHEARFALADVVVTTAWGLTWRRRRRRWRRGSRGARRRMSSSCGVS
jgi:hypothetical protein